MSKVVKNSDEVIKSTREGRLYIRTEDFFRQQKVQATILDLMNSDIIKDIEDYQRERRTFKREKRA